MAKINTIIQSQANEVIRDRIAEIIADEINNQIIMNYPSPDIDATVWVERSNSPDKTELPMIVVSLGGSTWGNKNQGSVDGTHKIGRAHV